MSDEFSDIGSVKFALTDARERIKESEDRCLKKGEEIEKRVTTRIEDLEELYTKVNTKIMEWVPLMNNLTKAEENKRNMTLLLVVAFISNIASWILTIFIYFVKSGVVPK
jgi:hypothetical protein